MTSNPQNYTVGLGTRFASGIIDIVFYVVAFSFISLLFTGEVDNLGNLVGSIPILLYIIVFHGYLNQTPGMKIMHIKFVESQNLGKPKFWRMVLRYIVASFFRAIFLGIIFALFTFKADTGFFWDRWFRIKVIIV